MKTYFVSKVANATYLQLLFFFNNKTDLYQFSCTYRNVSVPKPSRVGNEIFTFRCRQRYIPVRKGMYVAVSPQVR